MNAAELSDLDARVLRALRSNGGYLTPAQLAGALQITAYIVDSALGRLHARQLVEEDGSGHQGFARTRLGDYALEWTP